MHMTAIICTAILGFLLFGLGFAVSMTRNQRKIGDGFPPDASDFLHKVVRAHGNTAEFAPFLALLILYLGSNSPPGWVLWLMILATASRVAIVAGLLMSKSLRHGHPLRFIGASGTYVTGIGLCIALLRGL